MPPSIPPLQPSIATPDLRPTLPPNISIQPVTATTLPAYRRLITLLLPIRYPDDFYKDSVTNPTPSSLALCALWNEPSPIRKRKLANLDGCAASSPETVQSTVIGGIQCRLEPIPISPAEYTGTTPCLALYIQTLAVLAPYRSLGVATALLDAIVATSIRDYTSTSGHVVEVYAHVWEANEDALEWYIKRGFEVEQEVIQQYYRKLRPSGARIVRRRIKVTDWLKMDGARNETNSEVVGISDGANPDHTEEKTANG